MKKNIKKLIISFLALAIIVSLFLLLNSSDVPDSNNDDVNESSEIRQEETKYKGISVYTREEWENDRRSLLLLSYPVTENEAINQELKEVSDVFASEYERVAQEQEQLYQDYYKETGTVAVSAVAEYIQHFDISFASDNYLLFVFDQYRSTGGTGSDETFSILFDRKSGERLALSSLFSQDNYLETLSAKSRSILVERERSQLKVSDFDSESLVNEWLKERIEHINAGTEPLSNNFNSLVISDNKELVIIFDKYQVGAGSDGVVKVNIPLEEITDIISPEIIRIFDLNVSPKEEKPLESEKKEKIPELSIDCSKESCVALTFDDGPSLYTNELLDILRDNKVKATFFLLGRSAKIQPDTVRRIIAEGHVIGNHSWDHKDLSKLPSEAIKQQVVDTDDMIMKIANYETTLLRPPYGAYSKLVQESVDKPIVLWNIDPEDWKDKDAQLVTERMSEATAGSIVLAHDIYPSTIEAIPQVIENLKQKGLKFVTINEMFEAESLKKGEVVRFRKS